MSYRKSSSAVSVNNSKLKQVTNSSSPGDSPDGNNVAEIKDDVKPKVSFFKALIKCYWLEGLSSNWGMLSNVISSIISPFVLG